MTRRQDFVAIDRFTGGAADGAKFDATYADRPTLKTRLVLDLDGLELERQDVALLALSLRDVCQGRVSFGFGAGKGYGEANGVFNSFACSGAKAEWNVPSSASSDTLDPNIVAWLNQSLEPLHRSLPQPPSVSTSTQTVVPDSLRTGTLAVVKTKDGKFEYILSYKHQATNKDKSLKLPAEAIASSLHDRVTPSVVVEFTFEGAKPVRVRPPGKPWETGLATTAAVNAAGFIHPYYFLALADRSRFPATLADESPIGHERLQPDRYTGTIRVRLTTKTPLLICDDESMIEDARGHKTFSMRTDNGQANGKPLVMSSSVRGMLRSAYEAVTNSRFGVFPGKPVASGEPAEKHGRRLGFRLPANTGLDTVPVRIVRQDGKLAAELLAGSSRIIGEGRVQPGDPVFAAWCGAYRWTPPGPSETGHRAEVWAYLTPWHYHKVTSSGKPIEFDFWNVEEVQAGNLPKPTAAPSPALLRPAFGNAGPASWGTPDWHQGYLCVTGRNMGNKHDERFFFSCNPAPIIAALGNEPIQQWRQLIQDYQDQHRRELENGVTRPPALPSVCTFSRHITHNLVELAIDEQELTSGDLCYAQVARAGETWKVRALYPVMISRKLYDRSPLDLLPDSLRPATSIKGLSPADRVFGWVSQDPAPDDPEPAYCGHVRVGQVTCTTGAVETFPQPRRLAILGQPKPAQGRFYLGQSNGSAQNRGRSKADAGYGGNNRIRGPKVYPHHRDFTEESWSSDERSNQNRSITGWVKPETVFELDLHLENLTRIELGAHHLAALASGRHFLRMGLGKPLGFGSVRAEIIPAKTRIADGSAWAATLWAWDSPPPVSCDLDTMKSEFESAIKTANPTLLQSFLRRRRRISRTARALSAA